MSEQEAVAIAIAYVSSENLSVERVEAARYMLAARFNKLYGYEKHPHNFWVVEFRKKLAPGVLFEDPASYLIGVEEVTHKAYPINP